MAINGIMMQYFEWDLEPDGSLWNTLKEKASQLAAAGVSAVWLPPAYKGYSGARDSGYGVYDIYDLGEFVKCEQEGQDIIADDREKIRTKYGTKDEYIEAIESCHDNGIQVYADVVLNHMTGAGSTEKVEAVVWKRNSGWEPWYCTNEKKEIDAWTRFHFAGRHNTYSSFQWNKECFDGVDTNGSEYDANTIYLFAGKEWDPDTDFDFLNCSDLDVQNEQVKDELKRWGEWYLTTTAVDGFRLDAIKHVGPAFYNEWLDYMGQQRELFTVGEYYSSDIGQLENYLSYISTDKVIMHLFDYALHEKFYQASTRDDYHLSDLYGYDTLVARQPMRAVTFVDNHDTQLRTNGDTLGDPREVGAWFKPHAYAYILLREQGYPCVFYKDYPEGKSPQSGLADQIEKMMKVRRILAYGAQRDYSGNYNEIGWTRESVDGRSGVAVLLSKWDNQAIWMYVGSGQRGKSYVNLLDTAYSEVVINNDGYGEFTVAMGGSSVWIEKEEYYKLFA